MTDTEEMIIQILKECPLPGYTIASKLEDPTLTPHGLMIILVPLIEQNIIMGQYFGNAKYYSLTDKGRKLL